MLHMFAFAVVSLLFLGIATGLSVLLYGAWDRIEAALRIGVPAPSSEPASPSRVRIVARTRSPRVMPSLRAAA